MARTLSPKTARRIAPMANREVQAQMKLAGLSVEDVSRRTEIPYARCSEIISGVRVHPEKFALIRRTVFSAPVPKH